MATAPSIVTQAPGPAPSERRAFVDVFRGLLIAHMALDHASLIFNAGRGGEELARGAPPATGDLFQFLTRFLGVPVAPAFFFMAGLMVALTSLARARRGVPDAEINRRLIVRGLVLIAVDGLVMGLPRAVMGFYSFMVLSSIGAAIILLALVRKAPSGVLLAGALAILTLHPLLDLSGWPVSLQAVLYEPVRSGAFRSLYPVIPWSGILVLGFVVGRDLERRARPGLFWLGWGGLCLALFWAVRLYGGYGNAYRYASVDSLEFWHFAKYPPDLPFLTWSLACIFFALAVLHRLTRQTTPWFLRPWVVYGRVPFFFYVVHFLVLGLVGAALRQKFGLLPTYLIWVLLLGLMAGPCRWYYEKKRARPNRITRYL